MSLLDVLLLGLAVSYLTNILVLQPKDSHEGPFKISGWYVEIEGQRQRFVAFDLIRFITGAYYWPKRAADEMIFMSRYGSDGLERWTCPTCLSLWVSLPFSAAYSLLNSVEWFEFIVVLLAVAAVSNWYNQNV